MIYVMSDLNGHLDQFNEMLQKIRFRNRDELYLLGNIIDCGPQPIPLLMDLMMRENVYPIIGYREYRFLNCFKDMPSDVTMKDLSGVMTPQQLALFSEWVKDGGNSTLTQFMELEAEDREAIIDYLSESACYDVAESCNKEYLLTGGGIKDYTPGTDPEEYEAEAFLEELSAEELQSWEEDRILVFGRMPVTELKDGESGVVYFGDSYVGINCDIANGGRLGCLRLGDEQDFYVD